MHTSFHWVWKQPQCKLYNCLPFTNTEPEIQSSQVVNVGFKKLLLIFKAYIPKPRIKISELLKGELWAAALVKVGSGLLELQWWFPHAPIRLALQTTRMVSLILCRLSLQLLYAHKACADGCRDTGGLTCLWDSPTPCTAWVENTYPRKGNGSLGLSPVSLSPEIRSPSLRVPTLGQASRSSSEMGFSEGNWG